jgi:hypothetical protein
VIVFILFIFVLDALLMRPLQRRAFRWRDGGRDDESELSLDNVVATGV